MSVPFWSKVKVEFGLIFFEKKVPVILGLFKMLDWELSFYFLFIIVGYVASFACTFSCDESVCEYSG